MRLHLPTRLRASLIAAVIAVSSSVYNAYAAEPMPTAPVDITTDGHEYEASPGEAAVVRTISGNGNTVSADRETTVEILSGDSNKVKGGVGAAIVNISGSQNDLTATTDTAKVKATISGNSNKVKAEKGDAIVGAITGNTNIVTGLNATIGDDDIIGNIEGDNNEIIATTDDAKVKGTISGNFNKVKAENGIAFAGAITGDSNSVTGLNATIGDDDTIGNIEGDNNEVIASTGDATVQGTISGDSNEVKAEKGDAFVGAITGNTNIVTGLNATIGDDDTIGNIEGDNNEIIATTDDAKVKGTISGDSNEVKAYEGNVYIQAITGATNDVIAQVKAEVAKLGGVETNVMAYAHGLGQDDEAISIEEFNAQGSQVHIATKNDEAFGYASGNGSIAIGSMSAVDGEVDPNLHNSIVSNSSFVTIDAMDKSDAHTSIEAAKYIRVGEAVAAAADTASNLTLVTKDVIVESAQGLELTNSSIDASHSITGTSLKLSTDATGTSTNVAEKVALDSLSLTGATSLSAADVKVKEDLLIDGLALGEEVIRAASLDSTQVSARSIELKNNASLDAERATVKGTTFNAEDSFFHIGELNGATGLSLTNSKGEVDSALDDLTDDVEVIGGEGLDIDGDLKTEKSIIVQNSSIEAKNISAGEQLQLTQQSTLHAKDSITVSGQATVTDSTVASDNGDIALNDADNAAQITGSTMTASNGKITVAADAAVAASELSADTIEMQKALAAEQHSTLHAKDSITVSGQATVTDSTVASDNGDIALNDAAAIDGATVEAATGSVTVAKGLTAQNDAHVIAGKTLTVTGQATVTGSELKANTIELQDALTATDGSKLAAQKGITVSGQATVTDSTVASDNGDIRIGGMAMVTDAEVHADNGSINIDQTAFVTGSNITADAIGISRDLTAEKSSMRADKEMRVIGNATMTDGLLEVAHGAFSVGGNAKVSSAILLADSIDVTGDLQVLGSEDGVSTVHADKAVKVGGKSTVKYSSVGGSSFTTLDGLDADHAAITSQFGITVGDAAIDSSVVNDSTLTAQNGTVRLAGTIDAQRTGVVGKELALSGVLNAGSKVTLEGKLTGAGTINKQGGDVLSIAEADSSVNINVRDASSLLLGNGARLGAVDMGQATSTLQVGSKGSVDTVHLTKLSLSKNTAVTLDTDLDNLVMDTIETPEANLGGVMLTINAMGDESTVVDQTRVRYIAGTVTGAAHEDVVSNLVTLNAYASADSIVFSKNYRGVECINQNQRNTASALADLEDHMFAKTGEMKEVMDALHHTRSAEESLKALDNLGGAGLSVLPRMVTDETHDHLQALRGNLRALAAGVHYRYENGSRVQGLQSSAISASITGGSTRVQGGTSPKYGRNSTGAMISGVHAVSREYFGGLSFGYSHATGDCGFVDLKSDALFFDAALIRRGARTTHTATLGLGSYSIDTTRHASIKAPGHDYTGTSHGSSSAMLVNLSYEAVGTILANERHNLSAVFQSDLAFGEFRGYSESGMGNAGLRSEYDDVFSLNFATGARYSYNFGHDTNPGFLSVEAMFVVDAGDRNAVVKNTFLAGGQTFEQKGPDAGACGFRVNAGALVPIGERWGVFGNMSTEFRADQNSVSGSVGVKYSF